MLGKKVDATRLAMCSHYADVDNSLGDLKNAIIKACMHKIMGLENDGIRPLDMFNPHTVLTRKDVVTTLDKNYIR